MTSSPSQMDRVDPEQIKLKNSSNVNSIDGKKEVLDDIAQLEDSDFKEFLDVLVSTDRKKDEETPMTKKAVYLLRTESDALKEESGSGDEANDSGSRKSRNKKAKGRHNQGSPSAAARSSTGGSLGSLQDLTENTPEASSAAGTKSGGSCGNLSRGSFKTQAPIKGRGRRLRLEKASTSQREGGSLQNLSKTEAASYEAKKLHKSGSLSQVFYDYGYRLKNRRQKTSSESSGRGRRSEEKEEECWGDEAPVMPLHSPTPVDEQMADSSNSMKFGRISDVASDEATEDDEVHGSSRNRLESPSSEAELTSVVTHTAHRDIDGVDKKIKFAFTSASQVQDKEQSAVFENLANKTQYAYVPIVESTSRVLESDSSKRKSREVDTNENGVNPERRFVYAMTELVPSTKQTDHAREETNRLAQYYSKESNYLRLKARKEKKEKTAKRKYETTVPDDDKEYGNKPLEEIMVLFKKPESNGTENSNNKNDKKVKKKQKKDEPVSKRKNGSALKEEEKKSKSPQNSALRETSSVEDLVSKSKLQESEQNTPKRVTVDDGKLCTPNYKSKDSSTYAVSKSSSLDFKGENVSEFKKDSTFKEEFYKSGDNPNLYAESISEGEFQEVVRKRKNKKKSHINPNEKMLNSFDNIADGPRESSNQNAYLRKSFSYNPPELSPNASNEKTKISETTAQQFTNLREGLHDFPNNKCRSKRYRKNGAAASAPQSDNSDSDVDDSDEVPADSEPLKYDMNNYHLQSSEHQASYANITKVTSLYKKSKSLKSHDSDNNKSPVSLREFPPLGDGIGEDQNRLGDSVSDVHNKKLGHNNADDSVSDVHNKKLGHNNADEQLNSIDNTASEKTRMHSVSDIKSGNTSLTYEKLQTQKTVNNEKVTKYDKIESVSSAIQNNLGISNDYSEVNESEIEPVVFTNNIPSRLTDIEFGVDMTDLEILSSSKVEPTSQKKINYSEMFLPPPQEKPFPNYEEVCNDLRSKWNEAVTLVRTNPAENIVWEKGVLAS